MVYRIFRFLLSITNKFYFKILQVKGAENIPKKGPVFLVANHPSAFLDPIVIATITNRPLYFLGKGILFQNKILSWLLPHFNVIPIFRSHETSGQAGKNKDIFSMCYKHFAKGGALLAFPEGISLTERKIKKIQSGTARICLGAEAENNFSLDIKIITIGLNFSNPHQFQSDLFINIDQPIHVSDYIDLYKQDSFKGAHALTDEIRRRLEKQVVAIEDSELDKLVANIEEIYKSQLLKDLGHSPKIMENDFNTTKTISESVHYFIKTEPERVEQLKNKINAYLNNLEHLKLKDDFIKNIGGKFSVVETFKTLFYLIAGLPFFLFGFINNFLPFRIPYWSAMLISKEKEFHGAIAISMGTFTFMIFYILQIYLINELTENWLFVFVYIIMLPISGFFAFHYYKRYATMRGNLIIFSLFFKRTKLITNLISERENIIEGLEKARKDYVAVRTFIPLDTIDKPIF